jgi:hypothetical protein
VNFFKQIICWGAAILFFTARFSFAQTAPAQSPSAVPKKLEVETIDSTSPDERRHLLSALTPEDREKFSEQFRNLPAGGPSNGKINALFMSWSVVDPAKAVESAKKFPTADTRRVAVEAICFGMKPEAAKMIAQSIKEFRDEALAPEQKERLLGLAIVKWSQADPAPAAQFLAEVYPNAATRLAKPGAGDGDLLISTRAVAANWGASAPQAALDWFQKKQQPENLVAVQSVILGWWRKDAKAAAAYVSAHVGTPNEREVAGMMSGAMAERDPRVAAQWVEWIKEERLRRRMRLGIAEIWTSHDPKAAGEWSKGLAGKEGEGAIGVVAGVWAFKDSAAAEKWIGSLHGRARDMAIRGYVTTMARTNQEVALNWAVKMQDREARTRLIKAIAAEWMKRNPDESKAWIKKSKLSEAEKKQLLENASVNVD